VPAPAVAATTSIASSPHVALGIPKDNDDSDDILIDERAYVISFSTKREVANWVAWRLDEHDLGDAGRVQSVTLLRERSCCAVAEAATRAGDQYVLRLAHVRSRWFGGGQIVSKLRSRFEIPSTVFLRRGDRVLFRDAHGRKVAAWRARR
jgi:hypothetical protein